MQTDGLHEELMDIDGGGGGGEGGGGGGGGGQIPGRVTKVEIQSLPEFGVFSAMRRQMAIAQINEVARQLGAAAASKLLDADGQPMMQDDVVFLPEGGLDLKDVGMVGRCTLTVSKPAFKAPMVSSACSYNI